MDVGPRLRRLHLVVTLTAVVGLLSVATGVANIASPTSFGPLSQYVPAAVQQGAGFTGALTGFLLLLSAVGLRRGLRVAWYAAVLLLPVTLGQGLVQSSQWSLPLVVVSLVALPVVALSRGRFTRRVTPTSTQVAAAVAILGVLVYGTAGAWALREQFAGLNTILDAFYFTLVTASTVGYGDAIATGQAARLFVVSLVVLGPASFGVAIGALLAPALEDRISATLGRMTRTQLELLEDHVVVLGYGELTEPILTELLDRDADFVVVTPDPNTAEELADREYKSLVADPSDEATLDRVNLDAARAVVAATNDDAEDALSVLTARQRNHDVRIVSAATERENVPKLKRAGADVVISPATIGGRLLVQSALGAEGMEEFADRLLEAAEGGDGAEDVG